VFPELLLLLLTFAIALTGALAPFGEEPLGQVVVILMLSISTGLSAWLRLRAIRAERGTREQLRYLVATASPSEFLVDRVLQEIDRYATANFPGEKTIESSAFEDGLAVKVVGHGEELLGFTVLARHLLAEALPLDDKRFRVWIENQLRADVGWDPHDLDWAEDVFKGCAAMKHVGEMFQFQRLFGVDESFSELVFHLVDEDGSIVSELSLNAADLHPYVSQERFTVGIFLSSVFNQWLNENSSPPPIDAR